MQQFIDAAHIVFGAGFMQWSVVCLSPSVSPIDRQQQRRSAGLLPSALWTGDWWIPAGDLLQALALSSNCGQRLVESRRRRLNTDLLVMVSLQCCVAAMNGKARLRKTLNSFSLVFHSSLHFTLLSVPFWCLFLFIMHLEELFFFLFCLKRGADLHMAQLMSVLLTVSCFSKIQIGFTSLVPASPGQRLLNVCVCF